MKLVRLTNRCAPEAGSISSRSVDPEDMVVT
jgi:hypothetical protein